MRQDGFGTGVMYVVLVFLAVGLAFLIFLNYQANTVQRLELEALEEAAAATPTPEPTSTPEPTPRPQRTTETLTLTFAGDIVGQAGLSTDAARGSGDDVSYDFFDELSGILPSLSGSDLSACTLVGTVSDEGPYDEGYHMPTAIATALAGVGFQIVNAATDHSLDLGMSGLLDTVSALRSEGLVVAGAYGSANSHGAYMADVHGVQVALLSYTYGTGGVSVVDNPWCLDIFTTDYMTGQTEIDYERIDADIAAVREAGADVVVCFLYWWDNTQYYTAPRASETDMAHRLFLDGADIIIGSGVKSPQPIVTETVERADGSKANCVACYSLSNMMSCFNDIYTNLSATAKIKVSRDTDSGETWISGVSYRPLFMLDTDDYDDYEEPGYKYRLLDAYDSIEDYDDGGRDISDATYEAILTGVNDLRTILGGEFDEKNGGVELEFPY